VQLSLYRAAEPEVDDVCRTHCEENERGFALTEDYNLSIFGGR
jgi:hypothetical protein